MASVEYNVRRVLTENFKPLKAYLSNKESIARILLESADVHALHHAAQLHHERTSQERLHFS